MMFFWVVPVVLAAILVIWFIFRIGTKNRVREGESRLDRARREL